MNRLIIIGNGFDLAHGLETSYENFMNWYWRKVSNEIDYHVDGTLYEDELIEISSGITHKYRPNSSMSAKQIITTIKRSRSSLKYKSMFFEELMNRYNYYKRWVDIEMAYYDRLKIFIDYRDLKEKISQRDYDKAVHDLNETMEVLKKNLWEFITETETRFNNDYKDFKLSKEYLNFFEKRTFENTSTEEKKQVFNNTVVVGFNYTSLTRKYAECFYKHNFSYYQIHGFSEAPDSIIFGYGDEKDENYLKIERKNDNRFFQFVKSFKYFRSNVYSKLNAFLNLDEPLYVDVLGHSLGLSDRTLLSHIFNHPQLKEVNLCYYRDDSGNDYEIKTFELSRHFSDKIKMREVVRVFPYCEPMPQIEKSNQ
jgi:hypothetical protein